MINCQPANPGGKAFIEPKLIPPVHSNQVTEPLMSEFCKTNVRYNAAVLRRDLSQSYHAQRHRQFGSYSDCLIFLHRRELPLSDMSQDPSSPWHPWPEKDLAMIDLGM